MRNYTYARHYLLWAALAFSLPVYAGITFRIYTGGPQAGEVHVDSPEGHYIYFRTDFQNDEMPDGLSIRRISFASIHSTESARQGKRG